MQDLFSMAQQSLVDQGPHYRGFTITLRHTTFGRTALDEWSARRRDLYLTTRNTHKTQTSMPPAGFEGTIPASERPQMLTLDRAATGIEICKIGNRSMLPVVRHTTIKSFQWVPICSMWTDGQAETTKLILALRISFANVLKIKVRMYKCN
jgi:hypothetical protein